jgi:hypothetical protein
LAQAASSLPCAAGRSFAEAHRLDLRRAHAQQRQRAHHRLGALLAQRQVVFAAAALVGVAFDDHAALRIARQRAGVALDHRLELVLDDEAVEVEIDDARQAIGRGRGTALLGEVDGGDLRLRRRTGAGRGGLAAGAGGGGTAHGLGRAALHRGGLLQLDARRATGQQGQRPPARRWTGWTSGSWCAPVAGKKRVEHRAGDAGGGKAVPRGING